VGVVAGNGAAAALGAPAGSRGGGWSDEVRRGTVRRMASAARASVASGGCRGRPEVVAPELLRRAICSAWRRGVRGLGGGKREGVGGFKGEGSGPRLGTWGGAWRGGRRLPRRCGGGGGARGEVGEGLATGGAGLTAGPRRQRGERGRCAARAKFGRAGLARLGPAQFGRSVYFFCFFSFLFFLFYLFHNF
jgi:hypothetical protein